MLKKLLLALLIFAFPFTALAVELGDSLANVSLTQIEKLGFNYPTEIHIDETLELSANNLKNDLTLLYPNEVFSFEWDIRGASTQR